MNYRSADGLRNSRSRLLICLCAFAAVLPLALRGSSCGHDFDFHLQSWLAVAQDWRHAVFYPRWIEGANYGAGEPRFVFYPPLTWMLGALLGTILPWAAVPFVFTFLVLVACGLSMYKLASAWLAPNAAMIAAYAYVLNPYALFVAYERTAYGELAAGIWLPLLVFYALRHTSADPPALSVRTWDFYPNSTLLLALTIAAIWLTNAPAAVMASYLVAAIALWRTIAERQWQPILQSVTSLVLGLGLAAFYLVPAAYERRWVDIARAVGPGMRIQDSFLFGYIGDSFHDQVLRTASLIFVSMSVAIVLARWLAWRRDSVRKLFRALFLTTAVLLALQLPWSERIWQRAPELSFLQFPWRFSLVLSIAFAIAVGAVTTSREAATKGGRAKTIILVLAVIGLLTVATRLFWQPCDEEDAVSAQVALFQSGTGFEGTDEYTTLGVDNSTIPQGLPQIRVLKQPDAETATSSQDDQGNPTYAQNSEEELSAQVQVQRWQPEKKIFTITARAPGYAVLRLMDYPAWRVRVNGVSIVNRPRRDDGLLVVPISFGVSQIEIRYAATTDVLWGRGLSVASLLVLIVFVRPRRSSIK